MTRILGIDPGSIRTGYGIIQIQRPIPVYLHRSRAYRHSGEGCESTIIANSSSIDRDYPNLSTPRSRDGASLYEKIRNRL